LCHDGRNLLLIAILTFTLRTATSEPLADEGTLAVAAIDQEAIATDWEIVAGRQGRHQACVIAVQAELRTKSAIDPEALPFCQGPATTEAMGEVGCLRPLAIGEDVPSYRSRKARRRCPARRGCGAKSLLFGPDICPGAVAPSLSRFGFA